MRLQQRYVNKEFAKKTKLCDFDTGIRNGAGGEKEEIGKMMDRLMRALHLDAKTRRIRRQEKLSASEFMEFGPDEWLARRIAARESGAESGPIFLPDGWRYTRLRHYDAVQTPVCDGSP